VVVSWFVLLDPVHLCLCPLSWFQKRMSVRREGVGQGQSSVRAVESGSAPESPQYCSHRPATRRGRGNALAPFLAGERSRHHPWVVEVLAEPRLRRCPA